MKVYLIEDVLHCLLRYYWFGSVGSIVAQDGIVEAIREINIVKVVVGADPVVLDGLVRGAPEHKNLNIV